MNCDCDFLKLLCTTNFNLNLIWIFLTYYKLVYKCKKTYQLMNCDCDFFIIMKYVLIVQKKKHKFGTQQNFIQEGSEERKNYVHRRSFNY